MAQTTMRQSMRFAVPPVVAGFGSVAGKWKAKGRWENILT